jgi:hypothetical protein
MIVFYHAHKLILLMRRSVKSVITIFSVKISIVKPFILTRRYEEILKAIHFYRYMTAQDAARLLFSPSSLTHVREILASLAANQYLYRFQMPHTTQGNTEKIYTLGSRGRDYLIREAGLAVDWWFRPARIKHLGYTQIIHNLTLTRFLVAAAAWAARRTDFKLIQTRICYELVKIPGVKVVPDAWLLFEKLKNGAHEHYYPVLLEIDRGVENQHKFKQHVSSRIEFIRKGGAYNKQFGMEAVTIAYATTGEIAGYREARRRTMCAWTQEVLADLHKEKWAYLFRFHGLCLDDIYNSPIFQESVWYRPDASSPVPLFTP